MFDCLIVGGGASGIMAAISCRKNHPDFKIAIIDRSFALGRKILVCGAGRCNITNINLDESVENHYYGAPKKFIKSVFDQFGYSDITNFFNDLGIDLYVERKTDVGKVFPVTNQATTVTALLEDELKRLDINLFLNTDVIEIKKDGMSFKLRTQNNENKETKEFESEFLILSAGGKTYPALGSNGSGFDLAKNLGHTVIVPVPSALPLVAKNPLSQELQGTKFDIEVTSEINGERIKTRADDVMFTQYGLSGPGILNISREISIRINREQKYDVNVLLNFFPEKNKNEVAKIMEKRWQKRPDQSVEKSLFGLFPNKFPQSFLKVVGIESGKLSKDLSQNEKGEIISNLASFRIKVSGTRGWNEAEFTAGGIDTKNVVAGTLESTLVDNLYFCGEILNVDGDVGGFNLSWAWSSGYVAGKLE